MASLGELIPMPTISHPSVHIRIFVMTLSVIMIWSNALPVSVNAMPYAVIDVPGALDTTFDTDGKVLTDFGNSDDLAQAIAVQPDGKILVAGLGSDKSGGDGMALVRYNSDGSLDLGFGTNGIVATFTGTGASADALALQADGKIVVAGSSIMAGFVLVRYDSNGSVDPMFGTNGQVTTSFNANPLHYDYAHSIAIQSDGKIIAAGASYTGDYSDFALARYETNGSLDTTFDGDGKVITDFGGSNDGYSIALQPDGKLVMAGGRWNGSAYDFALARYNINGSLDTAFDGDGKVITDLGNSEFSSAVALQGDGKIVLAGNTDGLNRNFVLARYSSSGSLDTTFDGDGKVTTDFGNNNDDDARGLTIQSNGKIIVTGSSGQGSNTDLALARYNSSGSLDTTFDSDGKVTTAVGSSADNSYDIVLQSDGKIIIAGGSHNQLNVDVAVARYNSSGSLDTTFSGDGKVTTDLGGGSGYEFGEALALQSDGKIVVAGSNSNGNTSVNFAVARYNSDGSLDVTFGTDGKVTTDFGLRTNGVGYTNYGRAVATQTDGKIIVAGSSGNGGGESQFALARYNTNGTLDTTFNGDGKVTTAIEGNGQAWAVAIQPDGKIIVAGDNGYPNSNYTDSVSFALARFNSNGSLDTTFDMDGKLTTSFGLGSLATIQAVTIQPDGKIIVAGFNHKGSYSDFALARYNTNGSLDATFDGDGKVATTFGGSSSYSYGYDLVLQPDGKILVAGDTRAGPDIGLNYDLAIARYNANGSLDTTFDIDGKVITDFGNSADEVGWAVELQPDDRIVVAGRSYGSFTLARYTPNGSLDPSFDSDGKSTVDIGSDLGGGDAALQSDGKIVIAGSSWHDNLHTNYDFALARVLLGAYEFVELDTTPPIITSIVRADGNHTSALSLSFTVTFSEPVTEVDTSDFTLKNVTGMITGATINNVTGMGTVSTVTVNTGSGNGTLGLDVPVGATISDLAGNPIGDLPFTSGEIYTILKTPTFSDAGSTYWAWNFVERLYQASITGGCALSPLQYCPETIVTRSQMAVFLERGIHGSSYSPPMVEDSTGFTDVSTSYWAAAWIKQLAAEGITGGCGSGKYCPEVPVTRAQMAIFLLRSKHGASYAPPILGGSTGFSDVPTSHWAGAWIKQLVAEGITAGCGTSTYCPESPVTRAQMAVFLVRAFNLP